MKNDYENFAFPTVFLDPDVGSGYCGMSLRDYFAGQALPQVINEVINWDFKTMAQRAYEVADAMLKEREKYEE